MLTLPPIHIRALTNTFHHAFAATSSIPCARTLPLRPSPRDLTGAGTMLQGDASLRSRLLQGPPLASTQPAPACCQQLVPTTHAPVCTSSNKSCRAEAGPAKQMQRQKSGHPGYHSTSIQPIKQATAVSQQLYTTTRAQQASGQARIGEQELGGAGRAKGAPRGAPQGPHWGSGSPL
jgi:hypothetical protein